MKLLLAASMMLLTACAPMMTQVANYYDSRDPCQIWNKPQGYRQPNFCGAGGARATITDARHNTIGYIK